MSKNSALGIIMTAFFVAMAPQFTMATVTSFEVPPESEKGTFSYAGENTAGLSMAQVQADLNTLGSQGFHVLGPILLSNVNLNGYYVLRKNTSLNQQFSYILMYTGNSFTVAQIQALLATYGPQGYRIITYGQYWAYLILEKVTGDGVATYSYDVVNLANTTDYQKALNNEGSKGFRFSYVYASNDTNVYTFFEKSSIGTTYHYVLVPLNQKDFNTILTEFNTYGARGYRSLYAYSAGTNFQAIPWFSDVLYERPSKSLTLQYSTSPADNSTSIAQSWANVQAAWNSAGPKGKQGIYIGYIGGTDFNGKSVNLFEHAK